MEAETPSRENQYTVKDPAVWTNVFYAIAGCTALGYSLHIDEPLWVWYMAHGIACFALSAGSTVMHLTPKVAYYSQDSDSRRMWLLALWGDYLGIAAVFTTMTGLFAYSVLGEWAVTSFVLTIAGFALPYYLAGGSLGTRIGLFGCVVAIFAIAAVSGEILVAAELLVPYAVAYYFQGWNMEEGTRHPIHGVWHAVSGLSIMLGQYLIYIQ